MSDLKMFAIAGDPVLHTRSPLMFSAAFDALHMDNYRYLRLGALLADEIIRAMRELPISAFNITSPFKEDVMPLLDSIDEDARKIGAVNAVCNESGLLKGYNTDVAGVEAAFRQANIPLMGRKAVVLGAGGAAKAAVAALKSQGSDVVVINRDFDRAVQLASSFCCKAARLENTEKELSAAEILISCLPGGVDAVPDSALRKDLIVLDANYGEKAIIARKSARYGCTTMDGLEWLIGQGVAAFTLFTGLIDTPADAMRRAVSSTPAADKSNIALIGFMGAGKSVVGRQLSKATKMPLVDIDLAIEKKCDAPIREIFRKRGEEAFRKMELDEIERVSRLSGMIIACGGGAVLDPRAVDHLRKSCIVVWLWCSAASILRRVSRDNTRPLLQSGDRKSKIDTMLKVRNPLYADASDMFIYTDDKAPEEIARRIECESSKFLKN